MRCLMRLLFIVVVLFGTLAIQAQADRLSGFSPLSSDTHPSLLCVGEAKAGTTDFFVTLMSLFPKHFNKPNGTVNGGKEILLLADRNFKDDEAKQSDYRDRLNKDGGAPFTVDMSPLYLWSDVAPHNARIVAPNGAHTIAILRDPVSHLISFLNWRKGGGGTPSWMVDRFNASEVLLMELQLLTEPRRYRQLMASMHAHNASDGHAMFLDLAADVDRELGALYGNDFTNRGQGYTAWSVVVTGMRLWLDSFASPGRTLVVMSDAWNAGRADVWANAVMPFLFGDDEQSWPEYNAKWLAERGPSNKQSRYAKEVSEQVQCMLHVFYHPFVCLLEQLLRDNSHRVAVYPPERLDGTCRLWRNKSSDMISGCKA